MKRIPARSSPSSGNRASAMIVILIVVAIILIVMVLGPLSKTTEPGTKKEVIQGIAYIDHSADIACQTNRQAMETELTSMKIDSGGAMPSADEIRKKLGRYQCPRGGAIVVGKDGKIYCTLHDPPPLDQLKDMVTLFEKKPDETPAPPPPVFTPAH